MGLEHYSGKILMYTDIMVALGVDHSAWMARIFFALWASALLWYSHFYKYPVLSLLCMWEYGG